MAGSVAVVVAIASCTVDHHVLPPYPDYYEPCSHDWECPGAAECWVVDIEYVDGWVSDSMCTRTCDDDFDCPFDGLCEDAALGPPLCFAPCVYDFDCPAGFACVDEVDGRWHDPICLPW